MLKYVSDGEASARVKDVNRNSSQEQVPGRDFTASCQYRGVGFYSGDVWPSQEAELMCWQIAHITLRLFLKVHSLLGTWGAQLVKHLTLAQVMISQLVGSSPASGSVLTAQSLQPVWDSVPAPPRLVLCLSLSLSLSKINIITF